MAHQLLLLAGAALHAGAAHIAALLAGHAGTTLAGMALHQGASTIVGEILPHVLAHTSAQHLATAGINMLSSTAAGVAGASSGLGAAWAAGSGAFGAFSLFSATFAIKEGGHGNSNLGKLARFLKKFPWKDLANRSKENIGKTQLLNVLFVLAFVRLDEVYASLEHKGVDGRPKTRLDQVRTCTGCTDCVDFAKETRGSLCVCGCSNRKHQSVTWEENFLGPRAGFLLLASIAAILYKDLNRVGISADGESTCAKDDIATDVEKCTKCGCTDFILEPPWRLSCGIHCVCGHPANEHKSVDWDDESAVPEIFLTSLSVLMDSIYQEMGHEQLVVSGENVKNATKESIFQIEPYGDECVDFRYRDNTNFTRWFMAPSVVKLRAYCYCGRQDKDHHRLF